MVTMRVGVAAVFAWALVACGGDDPTGPKAASIQVNVAQVTIPQLDSVQIIPSVLDAGGTLLSGGVGLVVGSLLGVLVLGLIQTFISFEGTLSSWWTRIVIGALLLVFVVLQRFLVRRRS